MDEREADELPVMTLAAGKGENRIEADFVPGAGMVCSSLRHRGEELLGLRGGLAAYVSERSTMGIPLLYPWANRLSETSFEVAGREVALGRAQPPPKLDQNGLPMHGLLAAADGWVLEAHEADGDPALLRASFDFSAHPGLIAAFPFPHRLGFEASLSAGRLRITTTVQASGEAEVPVAFGYHPYLRLPGVERSGWEVEVPVSERLALDDRMLPTGGREPASVEAGPLGDRTFDDAFAAPPGSAPFVLRGGGREVELALGAGYPYTQVYAPPDDDVIAFEPMTAPTNALVTGGAELPLVAPGESYEAEFSVAVRPASSEA